MAFRNLIVVDGEDKDIKELSEEERKRLAELWNRRAADAINYKEIKSV